MTAATKIPAMVTETGEAVYILETRTWATENGTVDQCAIAPVGKYADAGLATGWVNETSLMRLV